MFCHDTTVNSHTNERYLNFQKLVKQNKLPASLNVRILNLSIYNNVHLLLRKASYCDWKLFLGIDIYVSLHYSLLAFATCAREFNYVRPDLVSENVIDIKAGR
jgi:hypothetical protein